MKIKQGSVLSVFDETLQKQAKANQEKRSILVKIEDALGDACQYVTDCRIITGTMFGEGLQGRKMFLTVENSALEGVVRAFQRKLRVKLSIDRVKVQYTILCQEMGLAEELEEAMERERVIYAHFVGKKLAREELTGNDQTEEQNPSFLPRSYTNISIEGMPSRTMLRKLFGITDRMLDEQKLVHGQYQELADLLEVLYTRCHYIKEDSSLEGDQTPWMDKFVPDLNKTFSYSDSYCYRGVLEHEPGISYQVELSSTLPIPPPPTLQFSLGN